MLHMGEFAIFKLNFTRKPISICCSVPIIFKVSVRLNSEISETKQATTLVLSLQVLEIATHKGH